MRGGAIPRPQAAVSVASACLWKVWHVRGANLQAVHELLDEVVFQQAEVMIAEVIASIEIAR